MDKKDENLNRSNNFNSNSDSQNLQSQSDRAILRLMYKYDLSVEEANEILIRFENKKRLEKNE